MADIRRLSPLCVGGTLVFVDLAGNEAAISISRPSPEQRLQIAEQKEINKSLFSLKECIRGLHQLGAKAGSASRPAATRARTGAAKGKGYGKGSTKQQASHIAFRGSRLTMV